MSPYSFPVSPIEDVSKYFRTNNDTSVTFIGESLELRIPRKFSNHGMLEISDQVTTLGVMDMIFDKKYHVGLNLLASITICPSDMSQMTYQGIEYVTLFLEQGDVFMTSSKVVQSTSVIYVLWTEFFAGGNLPYWYDYKATLAIFEHARELTGSGIGVSRSVFEGIVAHISRDPTNVMKQYRLTDMKVPMKFIPLKSVSQATTSTLAKLNGSYFRDDGLTSALRFFNPNVSPFENLLRGLPSKIET